MKLKNLAATTLVFAVATSATVAYAFPGGDRGPHRGERGGSPEQKAERMFAALDADASETVTLDEWLAKPTEKAGNQFDRIDADDDALISLEEFLATKGPRGGDRPEIDRDAVRACAEASLGSDAPERPDRETIFANADIDDSGFLDTDEFLAAKTERATTKFNLVDANADGAITLEELTDSLGTQRERRSIIRECVQEQRELTSLVED